MKFIICIRLGIQFRDFRLGTFDIYMITQLLSEFTFGAYDMNF